MHVDFNHYTTHEVGILERFGGRMPAKISVLAGHGWRQSRPWPAKGKVEGAGRSGEAAVFGIT